MLGLIKKSFFTTMMLFGCNLSNINSLKCFSMKNQECKIRPEIVNVNSDELVFFSYSIKQVNVVAVVIISMIHFQSYVLLVLLKILISNDSI